MLSMSIFPLWWSSFSETAGRRTIYILSFTLFIVFNIIAAVSTSIGFFIAMRILSGGAAAAVQAVGAGTVADIWEPKERGRAMGIFYLGPLCGPLLAPIIGGGLTKGFGWRSTQWFQVIYGGVTLLMVILCLPETLKTSKILVAAEQEAAAAVLPVAEKDVALRPGLSRMASHKSVELETRKWLSVLRRVLLDPFHIIAYLRFPAVALTVYYASMCFGKLISHASKQANSYPSFPTTSPHLPHVVKAWHSLVLIPWCTGCLYFINISVEVTFSKPPYNFGVIEIGALYIFNSMGYLIASLAGGPWVDAIMKREARKANRVDERGRLILRPEDRMRENAWTGALVVPIALLWYGWCTDKGVFWVAPMIANFFFGFGSMLIFGMATTMLTEFMPKKASNGVAVNNFCRNIFSFAGTFLAEPLINAIGNGWLFTILGIIAFLSLFVIVAMRRYCEKWRKDMDEHMT